MNEKHEPHPDADIHKGATEDDAVHRPGETAQTESGNMSRAGQIGHRSPSTQHGGIADGDDSDFPEQGESPEHSGQSG